MKRSISTLFSNQDLWSNWLGLGLLVSALVLIAFSIPEDHFDQIRNLENQLKLSESNAPYHTVKWYDTTDELNTTIGQHSKVASYLKLLSSKPV